MISLSAGGNYGLIISSHRLNPLSHNIYWRLSGNLEYINLKEYIFLSSQMPKQRIKPEYILELSNGVIVYLNQIGDVNGEKCFLITDVTGKFNSFVITADALPLEDEILTRKQQEVAVQLKKIMQAIINGEQISELQKNNKSN